MTVAPSTCPSCNAVASGRFCSACGTTLAGAVCANCSTSLSPGAKFCHRCGTPAGESATPSRGVATAMPWAVAAIALVALIALVVGQRFGSRAESAQQTGQQVADAGALPADQGAPGMPRAPDISKMTPAERADRLFDRIMRENEAGNTEAARTFMPMAIAAYEAVGPLSPLQRYDLGRIGIVGGDSTLARAQADTILRTKPTHLLGLILGAQAARLNKNEKGAKEFDAKFLSAMPEEQKSTAPEYASHANDISAALARLRPTK